MDATAAQPKISGEQAIRIAMGPSFVQGSDDETLEESFARATVPRTLTGSAAGAARRIDHRNVWVVYFAGGVDVPITGTPNFGIPGKTPVPVPQSYMAEWYSLVDASAGDILESGSL